MSKHLSRREFIRVSAMGAGSAVLSIGLTGCNSSGTDKQDPKQASVKAHFLHGVASGDPATDRVIIWTRVTPISEADVRVSWDVALDQEFTQLVTTGSTMTNADRDYTVKVDAAQLSPDTLYYYRFKAGDTLSATGKTLTLPQGSAERLKLVVLSCANYPAGYFNVYQLAAAEQDVDIVLHLGDYIYEYGRGQYASQDATALGREVLPEGEIVSLADYRTRYAQYRSDEDLQALHKERPFICIWDDHEIANNSWKNGAENHNEGEGYYQARKLAALKAYFEWMPLRPAAAGDELSIYRTFSWGELADLFTLDTRIIGRDKPLDLVDYTNKDTGIFNLEQFTTDLADQDRQMLGEAQLNWLQDQFANSSSRWQVLVQQVLMGEMNLPGAVATQQMELTEFAELGKIVQLAKRATAGDTTLTDEEQAFLAANIARLTPEKQELLAMPPLPYNLDAWDGYAQERNKLLLDAKQSNANLVVLAGDTHNAWSSDLVDSDGASVGVEFATASVSSPGLESYLNIKDEQVQGMEAALTSLVTNLRYTNLNQRGYLTVTFTNESATAQWNFVDTVKAREHKLVEERGQTLSVIWGENKILQ